MTDWLTLQAWTEFLHLDFVALRGFRAIHRTVTRTSRPPSNGVGHRSGDNSMVEAVVEAATLASLLYVKRAYCLQRSAVLTRLLRRRGIAAELVIGYQRPPLMAHAWVEVDGRIVARDRDDLDSFHVLDRW